MLLQCLGQGNRLRFGLRTEAIEVAAFDCGFFNTIAQRCKLEASRCVVGNNYVSTAPVYLRSGGAEL